MRSETERLLVLGYGNPGRLDDGLGPAFAAAIEKRELPNVKVQASYQLAVEDATALAESQLALFVDAAIDGCEPFRLTRVRSKSGTNFTSHLLQPAQVLALTEEIFNGHPAAYMLGIRGYEFNDFGESLSERARKNLNAAVEFMLPILSSPSETSRILARWAEQPLSFGD